MNRYGGTNLCVLTGLVGLIDVKRIELNPSYEKCEVMLSCDHVDDAINSLSLFHNLPRQKIEEIYLGGRWPDFIDDENDTKIFWDNRFVFLMSFYLGHQPNYESNFTCAYYHRTLFDGNTAWFDDGLLNALDGTVKFLNYLKQYFPYSWDYEEILETSTTNIHQRSSLEGQGGGGPYAWDRLEDATAMERAGGNYSSPEFFTGPAWSGWFEGNHVASPLIEIAERAFLPVVVKFKGKPSDIDTYIGNLWSYLYEKSKNQQRELIPHTFLGKGISIPSQSLMCLFMLDKEI